MPELRGGVLHKTQRNHHPPLLFDVVILTRNDLPTLRLHWKDFARNMRHLGEREVGYPSRHITMYAGRLVVGTLPLFPLSPVVPLGLLKLSCCAKSLRKIMLQNKKQSHRNGTSRYIYYPHPLIRLIERRRMRKTCGVYPNPLFF